MSAPLSGAGKVATFLRCARALGRTSAERSAIVWRLSKNVRVRLGLARYHPDTVYQLATRYGPVFLRDNFGDVTNLPGLLVDNAYRVTGIAGDGVVFDVGANIGLFSRWIGFHNPGRPIHSFEPVAGNVEMVRRNCPGASVNRVGLGAAPATVRLGLDAHGIMATTIAQRWETKSEAFQVIPLDAYTREHAIARVAFLKIDTEGMELDVLDGAPDTLRRTVRVAMETHGPERHRGAQERLAAAGLAIDDAPFGPLTGMIFASRHDAA